MAFCATNFPSHVGHPSPLLTKCRNVVRPAVPRRKSRTRTPLAVALPPTPTLLLLTAASARRALPETVRGPPAAFLGAALLANLALLPSSAPVYSTLIGIAPSAVCLLLLQRRPAEEARLSASGTQSLVVAFAVGAAGTAAGAILAGLVCPLSAAVAWRVAAAFAATYIGGSVNYVGVINALNVPAEVAAAGLAADLAAMAVYLAGLFALAAREKEESVEDYPGPCGSRAEPPGPLARRVLLLMVPIVLTVCITAVSRAFAQGLALPAGVDLILMSGTSMLLGGMRFLQPYLRDAAGVGNVAVTAFFAALGATARLSAVAGASPAVLGVAAVVLSVHALAMVVVGRAWLRLPMRELLLASNANVGGASTAAAFAAAFGWRSLVPGAVLVGTVGYLLGTPVGLLIFRAAQKVFSGV